MFVCLLIRRPRRLRHLRRLAAATAPATRTLLPGHPAPPRPAVPAQPTRLPLPPAFEPAEPGPAATDHHLAREEREERGVQARLHTAIDGRPHALRLESSDD